MQFSWIHTWNALPPLLWGAVTSVGVAIAAFCLALLLGTLLALAMRSRFLPVVVLIRVYISLVRGIPALIMIFLIYYVLPLIGLQVPALLAGILALSLNGAAFIAEIMRGGMSSISAGQFEASRSLGLSPWLTWTRIVLPQVLNVVIPPLMNEFTSIFKGTTLVSLVTVVEIMRVATQLISLTFRPIEILLGAAMIYFLVNFSVSRLSRMLEARNAAKLA